MCRTITRFVFYILQDDIWLVVYAARHKIRRRLLLDSSVRSNSSYSQYYMMGRFLGYYSTVCLHARRIVSLYRLYMWAVYSNRIYISVCSSTSVVLNGRRRWVPWDAAADTAADTPPPNDEFRYLTSPSILLAGRRTYVLSPRYPPIRHSRGYSGPPSRPQVLGGSPGGGYSQDPSGPPQNPKWASGGFRPPHRTQIWPSGGSSQPARCDLLLSTPTYGVIIADGKHLASIRERLHTITATACVGRPRLNRFDISHSTEGNPEEWFTVWRC
jgi:hypothetical protein